MTEKETVDKTRRQKYISTRGVVAWFSPMPPLLQERITQKMEKDGILSPDVPTYEVEVLGGETERHEYDEKSVAQAVDGGDEEAQELWEAYEKAVDDYNNEYNTRLAKAVKIFCVEVEGVDDDGWVKQNEYFGFEIPEDPIDRKLYFIDNEFVGSGEDNIALMQYPLRLTLERSGALQAVESLFRELAVERKETAENPESNDEEE